VIDCQLFRGKHFANLSTACAWTWCRNRSLNRVEVLQAEIFGIGVERMTSGFKIKDHAQEMENFVLT
jgi:hypothetical protein